MNKIYFLITAILLSHQVNAQFMESFEGIGTPTGWTVIDNDGQGQTWHFTTPVSSITPNTGSRVAQIKYETNAHDDYLITPAIHITTGTVDRVSFYSQNRSANYQETFDVKLSTTGTAVSDFTTVLATGVEPPTNSWQQYIYDLSAYNGQTVYIAIVATATNKFHLYIDDFAADTPPSCLVPTNVVISNIATTSADISWVASASGETAWEVAVQAIGAGTPTTTGTAVTSNSYAASGLTQGTSYEVYVRANCGNNDLSAWTEVATFTTLCTAVADLNEHFDIVTEPALANCWTSILDNGATVSATIATANFSNPHSAPNHVRLYNSDSPDTANLILVSPTVNNLSAGTHRLRFYAKNTVSPDQDLIVGTLSNPTDGTTFTPLQTVDINENYAEYIVDFTSYSGTDQYIGIRRISTNTYSSVYLDNIYWETIPSCIKPFNIASTEITANSASITWEFGGGEAAWEIVVQPAGTGVPTGTGTATTMMPHSLTGLDHNKNLEVYIRANCENNNLSAWAGPHTFTTACPIINTLNEGFENVSTPTLPDCWTSILDNGASSSAVVATSPLYAHEGNNHVRLYNYNSPDTANIILVSPQLNNLNAGTHRLIFYARNTQEAQDIQVGTLTDPSDGSTFTPLQTIDINGTYTEYQVNFSSYSGTDQYIGFKRFSTVNYKTVYLDDIRWEALPTCPEPTYLNIPSMNASSANLAWTENGNATTWDIEVVPAGGIPTGTPTYDNVTTNPYTIAGLETDSTYKLYLRADCGIDNTNTSTWSMITAHLDYCTPSPSSVDNSGITNVTMGTINNTTGTETNNYGNYSSMSTNINAGDTLNVAITYQTGRAYYTWVWIDWNNDLDFNDTSEEYYLGESLATNLDTLLGSIPIPSDTPTGSYRIRIGGSDSGLGNTSPSNPCYSNSYACFEDYSIYVIGDCMPSASTVSYTGCQGDGYSIMVGSTTYNEATPTGIKILQNAAGCDSIITVNLVFNAASTSTMTYTGCTGDGYSVMVGQTTYNEANPTGTETLIGAAATGCDSVVTVNLVFNAPSSSSITYTGCQGDAYSVMVGETTYNETNPTGTETLQNAAGCDSTVSVNLVFIATSASTVSYLGCQGDGYSVMVGETTYNENNPTGTETLQNAAGCDSVVTVNLVFNTDSASIVSHSGCQGDGYAIVVGETTYNEANPTGTDTLQNAAGCDSVVIVNLVFSPEMTLSTDITGSTSSNGEVNLTVVGGTAPYTYAWSNGKSTKNITDLAVGTYTCTVTDASGCTATISAAVWDAVNVNEIKELTSFKLNPNPASSFATIQVTFENATDFNLTVTNALGQVVSQESLTNIQSTEMNLDLNSFTTGLYFVRITTKDGTKQAVERLIIHR